MTAKTAKMNIILVHRAWADAFSWSKVIPVLKNSGHRVYILDTDAHKEVKGSENGEMDLPTIVYFQIPSDDIERSKKFYNELFGWTIDKMSESNTPKGMENWEVTTTDDKGNCLC